MSDGIDIDRVHARIGQPSPHRVTLQALSRRQGGMSIPEGMAATGLSEGGTRYLLLTMRAEGNMHPEPGWGKRGRWFATAEQAQQQARPRVRDQQRAQAQALLQAQAARRELGLQLASRPEGVDAGEFAQADGCTWNVASVYLRRLGERYELKTVQGKRGAFRYFRHVRDALAWAAARQGAAAQPAPQPKPEKREEAKPARKTANPAPQPVRNPKPLPKGPHLPSLTARAPDGPVVTPPHVRVQVLPSSPTYGRHAVDPREKVIGGFAAMGIGRYLEGGRAG